ncbi:MAG: protein kinase [Burkholderiales bacterium]
MARILVVEDDVTVREMVRMHLEAAGHVVTTANDGTMGLYVALAERPELVILDLAMPGLDGHALIEALRANDATAATPVIVLTGNDTRESARRAMEGGADDVIVKPTSGPELVAAVASRLKRVVAVRLTGARAVTERLRAHYTGPLPIVGQDAINASPTLLPPLPVAPALPEVPGLAFLATAPVPPMVTASNDVTPDGRRVLSSEKRIGTLVHITVRNPLAMARGFNAVERREVLQRFFSRLCEPLLAQFGWVVRHSAREIVALFESPPEDVPDHATRALRAALLAVLAAHQFRMSMQTRTSPGGINGPMYEFSLGVALDSGELEVQTVEGEGGHEQIVAGRLVDSLAQVDCAVISAGWSVGATMLTARAAGAEFATARTLALVLGPSTQETNFIEVTGFDPRLAYDSGFAPVYQAVTDAVRANSALADAQDIEVTNGTFGGSTSMRMPTVPVPVIDVPGYHSLSKVGAGGMSRVYLATHEESGAQHVLKIVPMNEDEDMLQRFIQEYALVAQMRHPNVARIFGQGFESGYAYIAMEHLAGGDLRDRISAGIAYPDAVRYMTHSALALAAIHNRGIVHRDLKPENLMLRDDASLVLADFGIAKQDSTSLTKTRHGEVYGTPFYMSPEQARGLVLDGRSDLYSLGIIFHEMLTGAKPFTGARAEALVYQHLHSDIPTLPGHFWRVQPILDRLLAKQPEDRFPDAGALLDELRVVASALEAEERRAAVGRHAKSAARAVVAQDVGNRSVRADS